MTDLGVRDREKKREQWVGGGVEKKAGYREVLLNFNFREVRFFLSRSNVKNNLQRRSGGVKE